MGFLFFSFSSVGLPYKYFMYLQSFSYVQQLMYKFFCPQISKDAQDFIVEQYKHLRERDTSEFNLLKMFKTNLLLPSQVCFLTSMFLLSGLARSAWRITVRQLESMIRLSEGMARLYCQDEVSEVQFRKYLSALLGNHWKLKVKVD